MLHPQAGMSSGGAALLLALAVAAVSLPLASSFAGFSAPAPRVGWAGLPARLPHTTRPKGPRLFVCATAMKGADEGEAKTEEGTKGKLLGSSRLRKMKDIAKDKTISATDKLLGSRRLKAMSDVWAGGITLDEDALMMIEEEVGSKPKKLLGSSRLRKLKDKLAARRLKAMSGSWAGGIQLDEDALQMIEEEVGPKKLLGSSRLRKMKDIAKDKTISATDKLLGSRRLKAMSDVWAGGITLDEDALKMLEELVEAKEEHAVETLEGKGDDAEEPTEAPAPVEAKKVEEPPAKVEAKVAKVADAVPSKAAEAVEKSVEIAASPAEVFEAAAGFEDYPKWAGSVQYVKVLERAERGLGRDVEYAVGAFGRTLSYTLRYEYDYPNKISWVSVAGSVKELIGSYEFFEAGEGRTRVQYKLAIDPGFPLPGMVKTASSKLIVSTALNELRKYSEKDATRAVLKQAVTDREKADVQELAGPAEDVEAAAPAGAEEEKPVAASAAAVPSKQPEAKVADAVPSKVVDAMPSKAAEAVEKSVEIAASPAEVFEAAAGFENYPKWAGSVQYVKVLGKTEEGLGKDVEYAVGAFGRTLSYTLRYEYDYPNKISWVSVAGSVKELIGSYEFFEAGEGRTRVQYKLAIDPGFPLPGMVKTASSKLIVSTALNELRKYSEKDATRAVLKQAVTDREKILKAAEEAAKAEQEPPAQAPVEAEPEEEEEEEETGVVSGAVPSASAEAVEQTTEIAASPAAAFEAAAGFEKYPDWAGSVQHVKVLGTTKKGLGKEVEFAVGAFGRTLSYTLKYEYSYPNKISWVAVAGSVKELIGSYEFVEAGEGRTKVVYKLAIDPGFPLPGMIKKASANLIVSTALNELRKYVEKNKGPLQRLADKRA